MPSLVSDQFRIFAAEQFLESLDEASSSNLYLFIGRPQPWVGTTDIDEKYENTAGIGELNPPSPTDNLLDYYDSYEDMISVKRINRSDLSQVIRKYQWESGTIYDMYRHDYSSNNPSASGRTTLYSSAFYVINSEFNVYKCISNGTNPDNEFGRPSTVEPTGTSTSIIESPVDGYRWKFMYSITALDYVKFVSTDFVPVKIDTTVSSTASPGSIDHVVLVSRGSSLPTGTWYCPVIGDGTGCVVRVVIPSSGGNAGKVDLVDLSSVGSGYTYGIVMLEEAYATANEALNRLGTSTSIVGVDPNQCAVEAIISPSGGHGSNAIYELGGYRVMASKTLDFLDGGGDIPVDTQFRRFGIIADPINANNIILTANTASACNAIRMPSGTTTSYLSGEIITQTGTGAKGRVIHWDSTTKVLRYYQNKYISGEQTVSKTKNKLVPFSGSNSIVGQTSGTSATPQNFSGSYAGLTFNSGYAAPEIKRYSGKILFTENRRVVNRSNDQIEDIKLIIEF